MEADAAPQPHASAGGIGRCPTPSQAAAGGAVRGMLTGLVIGIVWGVWEEKRFVLRNCVKWARGGEMEAPARLFGVMRRSVTTAPVVATFIGVHSGLRCWWHQRQPHFHEPQAQHQQQQQLGGMPGTTWDLQGPLDAGEAAGQQRQRQAQRAEQAGEATPRLGSVPLHQPALAGAAGTAAGAVRSLLAEAALTMHPLLHAQRSVAAGFAAAGLFALGGALEGGRHRQQRQEADWQQSVGLQEADGAE